MSVIPGVAVVEPHTISGHPSAPWLVDGEETGKMVTLCSGCGGMHTIIMLVGDRWYCSKCRAEGTTRNTKMFPIS